MNTRLTLKDNFDIVLKGLFKRLYKIICAQSEMIECTAPPQQPQKRGAIFWDTLFDDVCFRFQNDTESNKAMSG